MPQCDCWAHRALIPRRGPARATQVGPHPVPEEPPVFTEPTPGPDELDPHGDHTAEGDGVPDEPGDEQDGS